MEYTELAKRLREQRDALGLTQQDAADLAGFDRRTLSQFETGSGVRGISLRNLIQLAEVLGMTIDAVPRRSARDQPR